MPHRVELSPAATRDIRRLPRHIVSRVRTTILALGDDPRPVGARKLQGADRLYRVRIGEFRVVYELDNNARLVLILRVVRRSESTYRDL